MKTTKQNKTRKSNTPAAANSKSNLIVISRVRRNPLREGTFCHAQVEAVMNASGQTVAQAQRYLDASKANKGKRKLEIFWLQKKGFAVFKGGKKVA